ncbi:MAG: YncE family protein [Terriglobia bacterium]
MKRLIVIFLAVFAIFIPRAKAQSPAPLKLIQSYKMPAAVRGHFDHFGVDLQGNRLFSAAEGDKAVLVFDLRTGRLIHTIGGIGIPHAILYREDLQRIYVTDGGTGALRIYDGKRYQLLKTVKLLVDSDSIAYDPSTKDLYIVNGGGDAHQTYSTISVVNTTTGAKVADMKIDGDTLEAMALEQSSSKMYVNNRAKNQIDVIDRNKRTILAVWPVTRAKFNVAMAFDEPHHRLFVGCRSGEIVVFDTRTGKELQALPIGRGVDDLVFDPSSKRIYASCGAGAGSVDVYEEQSPDHYKYLGNVPSGPGGKTARLVPQLRRYYVAVPAQGSTPAEVLVYEVTGT